MKDADHRQRLDPGGDDAELRRHNAVYYGPDAAAALNWVRGFTSTSDGLNRLDAAGADRALGRLRAALATHTSDDGVWFNSRAWIVTAHRVDAGL
jgi:hypothetical protein